MNRKTLSKIAAEYGAELDFDQDDEYVIVWLPDGVTWAESGTQSMAVQFSNGSQRWTREAFADLADRMRGGVNE